MWWGMGITDTAKLSRSGRRVFLHKADELLARLERVRERAAGRAEPGAVAVAMVEKEKEKEKEEEEEEEEEGEVNGTMSMDNEMNGTTTKVSNLGKTSRDDKAEETRQTQMQDDRLDGPELNKPKHTLTQDAEVGETKQTTMMQVSSYQTHLDSRQDHVCQQAADQRSPESSKLSPAREAGHVLLSPWPETFAGRLETYLDAMDSDQSKDDGPDQLAMTPSHLGRLDEDIGQVAHLRASLLESISQLDRRRTCHSDRWKRAGGAADVAALMKSRGLGSLLARTADTYQDQPPRDEWEDWSSPRSGRSRLRGAEQYYGGSDWAKSDRNVSW